MARSSGVPPPSVSAVSEPFGGPVGPDVDMQHESGDQERDADYVVGGSGVVRPAVCADEEADQAYREEDGHRQHQGEPVGPLRHFPLGTEVEVQQFHLALEWRSVLSGLVSPFERFLEFRFVFGKRFLQQFHVVLASRPYE